MTWPAMPAVSVRSPLPRVLTIREDYEPIPDRYYGWTLADIERLAREAAGVTFKRAPGNRYTSSALDAYRREYAARYEKLRELAASRDPKAIEGTLKILKDWSREVNRQIEATPSEFREFHLRRLAGSIRQQSEALELQLADLLGRAGENAAALGVRQVVEPAAGIGISLPHPEEIVSIAAGTIRQGKDSTAGLVAAARGGLVDSVLAAVDSAIGRAASQEISVLDAQREITAQLVGTVDPFTGEKIVGGVAARAVVIVRTELQRIYEAARLGTMKQTSDMIPGALMRWVPSRFKRTSRMEHHAPDLIAQTPAPGETFRVGLKGGGYAMLRYPGDPAGPPEATINCGCTTRAVVSRRSMREALEAALKRAQARRAGG